MFDACQSHLWTPEMGDRIRGGLVLLPLEESLDLLRDLRIDRTPNPPGWLKFATAYELAAYAASDEQNGWDGYNKVMALGSKFGGGAWPTLDFVVGGGRIFTLDAPDGNKRWRHNRSILCVWT
jgi:hypothetical protein